MGRGSTPEPPGSRCPAPSCAEAPHGLSPAEKKRAGLFEQMTRTHGTIIGVAAGVVLVLLVVSVLVQVKQPRKKVLACKAAFHKPGFQEAFDPPHYELFSLRDKELAAELGEELDGYRPLRRASSASRCVHEHHCGAAPGQPGRTDLAAAVELPFRNDFAPPPPLTTFNSTFPKSRCAFPPARPGPEAAREDRVMEELPCEIYARGRDDSAQASISIDF